MTDRARVAVLISGRGSNFAALLEASAAADYPARIVACLTDTPGAKGLEIAQNADIPTVTVPRTDYDNRPAFEDALHTAITEHTPDIICLAGFMRILSAGVVTRWEGKMLNIHPSLLPSFRGLDTHARALEAGAKIHGATVHIVTPAMDDGPIIAQAAIPVAPNDTPQSLAARVLAVEHKLYPAALAHHLRPSANAALADPLFSPLL